MKLIKTTKVTEELLDVCSEECFLMFYNGEELVLPYAQVVEQKLEELNIEFTVVNI